jgi:hypothetical protein
MEVGILCIIPQFFFSVGAMAGTREREQQDLNTPSMLQRLFGHFVREKLRSISFILYHFSRGRKGLEGLRLTDGRTDKR